MADKCAKCSALVDSGKEKEIAQCVECKEFYHSGCCTAQTWTAWTKPRTKKTWKCDGCKAETGSSHSETSNSTSILAVLQDMRKEMADNMKESRERFDGLEASISGLRASVEETRGKVQALEEENVKLKEENESRKAEIAACKAEVIKHRLELQDLQQYSRRHNIEIKGIPSSHGENVYAILEKVANTLGVQWSRWDFSVAHRLQRPTSGQPATIIAAFINRSVREEWLSAAKHKRINATDISPRLAPGPVYLNSHLTPHNKQLLGRAKQMVRDRKLANAWVADSKVLVRKLEGGTGIRVVSMEDLDKFSV